MPLTEHALLQRLVAFPTVSSTATAALADFISDYAAGAGLHVWRQNYEEGRKANLLLRAGPEAPGRGLLLCGHLDVVPAGEPDWCSDPFQLTEKDGRLCGRGAADMKCFVALAIAALGARGGIRLRAPLWLLLTSDEEIGAIGAQRFADSEKAAELPRDAIAGEPTGLGLVRMHKGHLKLRLAIRGVPAHSGLPHLGVNAIELAGSVIRRLAALATEWHSVRNEQSVHFNDCPYPVLNLGLIQGGSAVNIVPAECVLDIGIRLLPGQTSERALEEVRVALGELPMQVRAALELTTVNDNPPLLCSQDAPVNRSLAALLGQPQSRGVSFASDAGVLAKLGLNCVLWGPGDMADAHRANESIAVSQLDAARTMLDRIVHQFCVEPAEQR